MHLWRSKVDSLGSKADNTETWKTWVQYLFFQESDAGEYTVTAVNEGGKIFHAVSVDVTGKVAVQEEITEEKYV